MTVNGILGNFNVDKQISDSKDDVSFPSTSDPAWETESNLHGQTAYLMADISDVRTEDLKEILEQLDALNCMCNHCPGHAYKTGPPPPDLRC